MNLTLIGLNKDMKSACLLSIEGIDWEWLKKNANIAHLINFKHSATSWCGHDKLDNILGKNSLTLANDQIELREPLVLKGFDNDCGNHYSWEFVVNFLLNTIKSDRKGAWN